MRWGLLVLLLRRVVRVVGRGKRAAALAGEHLVAARLGVPR